VVRCTGTSGRPIEAVVGAESTQVPAALRMSRPCEVLPVVGDAMREAGIRAGDYVVIAQCAQARNAALVVALIRGQEATLKRIDREPGLITRRAENPEVSPLHYPPAEVESQGLVVGQMRRYR
jgi:repressor LexA